METDGMQVKAVTSTQDHIVDTDLLDDMVGNRSLIMGKIAAVQSALSRSKACLRRASDAHDETVAMAGRLEDRQSTAFARVKFLSSEQDRAKELIDAVVESDEFDVASVLSPCGFVPYSFLYGRRYFHSGLPPVPCDISAEATLLSAGVPEQTVESLSAFCESLRAGVPVAHACLRYVHALLCGRPCGDAIVTMAVNGNFSGGESFVRGVTGLPVDVAVPLIACVFESRASSEGMTLSGNRSCDDARGCYGDTYHVSDGGESFAASLIYDGADSSRVVCVGQAGHVR